MRQWRLIYDCPTPGVHNMAIDEALLTCCSGQPVLRLYAWEPFCLSLGYGQRSADVDLERLAARGWDIVRRPSGGRAILHGDELTYSVILPAGHPLTAGGVIPSYRRLSRALLAGLNRMGVAPESNTRAGRAESGPVCFEMPSHYEITAAGRKLVGSAQLRREVGVLQHGSLPLCGDIGRICDVLRYPDEMARQVAQQLVRAHATTLQAVLGGAECRWEAAAEAIAEGFAEAFAVEFERSDLSQSERQEAVRLAREVYSSSAWTFRR